MEGRKVVVGVGEKEVVVVDMVGGKEEGEGGGEGEGGVGGVGGEGLVRGVGG